MHKYGGATDSTGKGGNDLFHSPNSHRMQRTWGKGLGDGGRELVGPSRSRCGCRALWRPCHAKVHLCVGAGVGTYMDMSACVRRYAAAWLQCTGSVQLEPEYVRAAWFVAFVVLHGMIARALRLAYRGKSANAECNGM